MVVKFSLKIAIIIFLHFVVISGWSQEQKVSIKEFVTKNYTHGIPYEQAKAYGEKVVPELIAMLNNKSFEAFVPNIVLVLGINGDAKALIALKAYFTKQNGELTTTDFSALLNLFQAFGHMAKNNEEALTFLINHTDSIYLIKHGSSISYNDYKGKVMNRLLIRLAIQGLAMSGTSEALSHLEQMQNAKSKKYRSDLGSDLKNAIDLNKKIRSEGSLKTYKKEDEL